MAVPPPNLLQQVFHTRRRIHSVVFAPNSLGGLRHEAVDGHGAQLPDAVGTVGGLGMLLHQARPAFESWFGVMPQVTPSLRALVEQSL